MKRLATIFLIVTLCPTASLSLAQGRRGGSRGGGRSGAIQMDERTTVLLLTALLSLTDQQRQQLSTILEAAAITAAPINAQLEAGKDTLFAAVLAGMSDEQIKTLAEQQGSLNSRMLALQARTFSKICALLNADQKSRIDPSIYENIGQFLSNARQPVLPAAAGAPPATRE
jgi:Spy/CpxP family protein refolding chaperone